MNFVIFSNRFPVVFKNNPSKIVTQLILLWEFIADIDCVCFLLQQFFPRPNFAIISRPNFENIFLAEIPVNLYPIDTALRVHSRYWLHLLIFAPFSWSNFVTSLFIFVGLYFCYFKRYLPILIWKIFLLTESPVTNISIWIFSWILICFWKAKHFVDWEFSHK